MGAEPTKIKERFITEIVDCEIKDGKKRSISSEIVCNPSFTNNVVVLLRDSPNYQDMMSKITIDKKHKIEYVWSNRYTCYVVNDITMCSP